MLYTWARPEFERFPSNFQEIEKNIFYEERENEFDITDSDNTESLLNVAQQLTSANVSTPSQAMRINSNIEETWIDIVSVESLQILR